MLSIRGRTVGSVDYYFQTTAESYYLSDARGSAWTGRGAKALGLHGSVKEDECRSLLQGFTVGGTPLVQNAGKSNRQAAWDLTFSLPKSASVLWAVGSPEQQWSSKTHIQSSFTPASSSVEC